MDVCILLKNASDNESLEWLWRGQKGHACPLLPVPALPWGMRAQICPHLLRGIYPEHPALCDKTNHAAHSSTQSQHQQPSQSVSCLSHSVSCHCSLPAILTEEINTRPYNISPSTSLALHRDNYLYLKCWDHPEANSYVEDWDCPNKQSQNCVLKAAATTVILLFSQNRVASLLCTNE